MPYAVLIAGCNGAGKTTFARQLLPARYPDAMFLNADEISREHPRFAHPVAAGRELLARLARSARARQPFAIETTLSSRAYAGRIPRWKRRGYRLHLHFIRLESADMAVARVRRRVDSGGHGIPEQDVRRRFDRGLALLEDTYRALVDECYVWTSKEGVIELEVARPQP